MQLQRVKHREIDFEKWDNTILSSRLPLVFAQSFYLNATSPNWDALVIDDYDCVFPLTYKTKFGFNYLPQPPFTSQLGAYGNVTIEKEKLFFEYILSHYKLIEIELNQTNQLQSEFIFPKNTFVINYKDGFSYNQNTKRNINKANTHSLIFNEVNYNDVLGLSQHYLNPFLINEFNLSGSSIKLFDQLLINAMNEKKLNTFTVRSSDGKLRAIAHFIFNNKHALFLKGTSFDREENTGSMHFLMDYAINYYKDKAMLFDFGGGSNSQGLAGFYQGLGGQKLDYGHLKINNLPKIVKLLKNKN